MAKPVIAYWDIRGLAEPARMMLEYFGVSYEDKRYVCGDGPNFDRSCWTDVKPTIGLDFPNLPYYIDGETKITESMAILKHIARKNKGLLPSNDAEHDHCDMVEGVIADFRRDFTGVCYGPGFDAKKIAFFDVKFPVKAQSFNEYLQGKSWLVGDTLTYVDFALCEILDHMQLMSPGCFDKFENVKNYLDRFFKLEKVQAYRQSDRFKKFPINNKMASWGGKAE